MLAISLLVLSRDRFDLPLVKAFLWFKESKYNTRLEIYELAIDTNLSIANSIDKGFVTEDTALDLCSQLQEIVLQLMKRKRTY